MSPDPLERLEHHQNEVLDCAASVGTTDCNAQFHPDLSPLGWHLGHCVYTVSYWLREVVLAEGGLPADMKALYVPELTPKPSRSRALPAAPQLLSWAQKQQAADLHLLADLLARAHSHPLLDGGYLAIFLAQHYAQHRETMEMVLAQRGLGRDYPDPGGPGLEPTAPAEDWVPVTAARRRLGEERWLGAYDNEQPALEVDLGGFRIARHPVSNAEYLGFMQAGGYRPSPLWDPAGVSWLAATGACAPVHWRRGGIGWYGVDSRGPHRLPPQAPVEGISHYEATAYARWAGAALPHEYEWEAAARQGLLADSGRVWEWCSNVFHPYPGFQAFPYDGYSRPYFDGAHMTLKGGSRHTRALIRRPAFRNYYERDKRHIFAGLRLRRGDA